MKAVDRTQQPISMGPDQGLAIWFLNNRMTIKATAATTGGAYGLIETWAPPGASPPLHVHHREDEAFWVLEGDITVRCGDETIAVGAGSHVFLPRDVPHAFVVEGEAPARLLTLVVPGGGESFFVEAGRPAEGDGLPPAGPPDIDLLKRVAESFGSEIIGPPIPPSGTIRDVNR